MRGIPRSGSVHAGVGLLLVPAALLAIGISRAQAPEPADLQEKVDSTVEVAKQTQDKLDDWSTQKAALETRYKTAQANIPYLQERLARQREVAATLDGQVAELERRLKESARLQAVVQDTLDAVLGRFEKVVARDLPFLPAERQARLEGLRRLNSQTETPPAEKLRRLLEAMLIEAQYGETVEVAPQTITVAGREIHADILRVGRLAMFWRSPDKKLVGAWDPSQGAWVALDDGYKRAVLRSMEIGSRLRPAQIVSLPLGRIAP